MAVIFIAVSLSFLLLHIAPGDPFSATLASASIDPATLAQWRTAYGLDRPILEQYIRFLGQAAVGNFGPSIRYHQPVADVLAAAIPQTITLMLIGLTVFATRASKTLGNIGLETTKHPDPAVQAKQVGRAKMGIAIGLSILALVVILAATGAITLDPQAIGKNMRALPRRHQSSKQARIIEQRVEALLA